MVSRKKEPQLVQQEALVSAGSLAVEESHLQELKPAEWQVAEPKTLA